MPVFLLYAMPWGGRLLNDFDFYFYHLIKSNKHNLQLEMK